MKGRLFICHIFITQNKRRGNFVQRETNLAQRTGRRETLVSGVEWNHASWIILTKHVRIMNLCFKNLGIMNLLFGSGIMNNKTLRKAQQNTRKISCVRSRECRIWRFRESNFPKFLYMIFYIFSREIYGERQYQFLRRKTRNTFLVLQGPKALATWARLLKRKGFKVSFCWSVSSKWWNANVVHRQVQKISDNLH